MRGLNSDYAVNALLELKLIYPCGRKDAVGRPVLFATTDEFLKRFKLGSLEDLPDYDMLMAAITRSDDDRDTYLYAREEYSEEKENGKKEKTEKENSSSVSEPKNKPEQTEKAEESVGEDLEEAKHEYEIPDFLRGLDDADIVKIS